jgi:hypothetical protein
MSFLLRRDLCLSNIISGLGKTSIRLWIRKRSSSKRVGKMHTLLFRGRTSKSLQKLPLLRVEATLGAINAAVLNEEGPSVVVEAEVSSKGEETNSVVVEDHLVQVMHLVIWVVVVVQVASHLLRRTRISGFISSNISRSKLCFQPVSSCFRRSDVKRMLML